MNRPALVARLSAAVLTISGVVQAQVQLSTKAFPPRVEVGQRFTVQLTALASSSTCTPSRPRLSVPRGVVVQGPSVSNQQQVSIVNGRIDRRQGLSATWYVSSTVLGRLRLGPASVLCGGQLMSDRPVQVEVVAPGSLPSPPRLRRNSPFPIDPFDMFGDDDLSGRLFGPLQGLGTTPTAPEPPAQWPQELNIDRARDPTAFLDARAQPKRAYVGQQVTLQINAYGRPAPFQEGESVEPNRKDFLSYDLMDDSNPPDEHRIMIGDDTWYALQVRHFALFPLKSGTLQIGPMQMDFVSRSPFQRQAYMNVRRRSQTIDIVVVEPPLTGRPPGYQIGDVGSFRLSAEVEPRAINAGDAVSVVVELSGTGQLPQHLAVPEQTGVDWLDPSVTQEVSIDHDRVGGKRVFSYVVHLNRPGSIDLGTVQLPFFDADRERYSVASARLGVVVVRPGKQPPPDRAGKADSLLEGSTPRTSLGSVPPRARYLADRPRFFLWLLIGPVAVLAGYVSIVGVRRLGRAASRRRQSPRAQVNAALREATEALNHGDWASTASSVERALHLSVKSSTGVRSRGLLRADLASALRDTGIAANVAEDLIEILDACDRVRFERTEGQSVDSLIERARRLVDQIGSHKVKGTRAS